MAVVSKDEPRGVRRDESTPAQELDPTTPMAGQRFYSDDEVLDLRFVFRAIFRNSWLILLVAIVGGAYGVHKTSQFQRQYVASMIIMPAKSPGISQPSSAGAGGLVATALGVSFGPMPTELIGRLKLTIASVGLAKRLDKNFGLLQFVYSGSWDAATGRWKAPKSDKQSLRSRLHRYMNIDEPWTPPNVESLAQFLNGLIRFQPIQDSSEYKGVEGTNAWLVSVKHNNPEFALKLLKTVMNAADELLREQDLRQVIERKRYLESRYDETSLTDIRLGILSSLMSTERSMMTLSGKLPYAARIVEAPRVGSKATKPNLMVIIGTPMLGGAILCTCIIILVSTLRRE